MQVSDLMKRDRFHVEAPRLPCGRRRPLKGGVEEYVRLNELAIGHVVHEGRGSKRPVEVGPVLVSEHHHAVIRDRPCLSEPDELRRDTRGLHRIPGGKCTSESALKVSGGNT